MGGTQSTAQVQQVNNVLTVNKSLVELLNTQINKTTSDTIVNQATSCGASSSTTLIALFQDIIAQGDINIDNTMTSKVSVDISCVNTSAVATSVSSQVSSQMLGQIDTAFTTLAQQAAAAQASSSSTSGFNPFAALVNNTSSSNISQYNTATTTNDSQTIVKSVIENVTANTFTTNLMNELKANVISAMSVKYKNLQAGGNVNINNLMDSTVSIIAQQVVSMDIGNKVTSSLLHTFNVGVTTDSNTTATQTSTAEAESKAESKGLLDFLGSLFSFAFLGQYGSSIMSSAACFVCLCLFLCMVMVLPMFGSLLSSSSSSSSGNSGASADYDYE